MENGGATDGPTTKSAADPVITASQSHRWPILTLAWLGIGAVLYVGKPAFAPLLFAVLLALLLSPLVDRLERRHVPRLLGALLTVGLLLATMTLIVDAAWNPALDWIDEAPNIMQKVERKIRPLQRAVTQVDSLATRATKLTNVTTGPPPAPGMANTIGTGAFDMGRVVLIDVVTVAILTVFLVSVGGRTLRKLEADLAVHGRCLPYLHIVEVVRAELSRYYSTLALINIGLALITTAVMALWGLPNPWLWGITAGVLNFIPYVGPTITLMVVTMVALVSTDGYGIALGVASSFLLITTIEGQIIQPLLVGFRLNLNPIVLFVAIWLAGWFWGVAGVFLITPILIAVKEIASGQTGTTTLKSIMTRPAAPNLIKLRRDALVEKQTTTP